MAFSGAGIARRLRRQSARGIVLCYHRVAGPRPDPAVLDVSPAHFDAHMATLREGACVMPLGEFERARGAGRLPRRAVAVTFDDGYADNLHAALPVLEAHGIPGTVFVTTSGIDAPHEFWWDALERICHAPHALPVRLEIPNPDEPFGWSLDDRAHGLRDEGTMGTDRGRASLYTALSAWLRVQPAAAQAAALAHLHAWSGTADAARESHRTLRADELQALARSPLVEIGSHSVTHPVLGLLDASGQREECAASRAALRRWLGVAPSLFAYPFGAGRAVTRNAEAAVRAAGYAAAFTTDARAAWRWNRASSVPRFAMQSWDGAEFARRLDLWFEE